MKFLEAIDEYRRFEKAEYFYTEEFSAIQFSIENNCIILKRSDNGALIENETEGILVRELSSDDWQVKYKEELKPKNCPFCNSEGLINNITERYYVDCEDGAFCALIGPERNTEEDAIKAWNRIIVIAEGDEND